MTESQVHDSSDSDEVSSHGHTTAAWTGVGIMLVATAIICLGMIFGLPIMWIPGILLFVGGAIAWPVMNKVGDRSGGPNDRSDG